MTFTARIHNPPAEQRSRSASGSGRRSLRTPEENRWLINYVQRNEISLPISPADYQTYIGEHLARAQAGIAAFAGAYAALTNLPPNASLQDTVDHAAELLTAVEQERPLEGFLNRHTIELCKQFPYAFHDERSFTGYLVQFAKHVKALGSSVHASHTAPRGTKEAVALNRLLRDSEMLDHFGIRSQVAAKQTDKASSPESVAHAVVEGWKQCFAIHEQLDNVRHLRDLCADVSRGRP